MSLKEQERPPNMVMRWAENLKEGYLVIINDSNLRTAFKQVMTENRLKAPCGQNEREELKATPMPNYFVSGLFLETVALDMELSDADESVVPASKLHRKPLPRSRR